MSTHRKIEHALFILGLAGTLLTWFSSNGLKINLLLFGIIALFAGLHSFHLFDGLRANKVVIGTSMGGVIFNVFILFDNLTFFLQSGATALAILVLIFGLASRLHKDFTVA